MPSRPPKFFSAIIILLGLLTFGVFYLYNRRLAPPAPVNEAPTNSAPTLSLTNKPTITIADPSFGSLTAKVTIVEFADYRCPHCGTTNMEIKKILATYPNDVRLVWKDFPFLPPLDITWLAHQAARCAERQSKFWEYHDILLANQDKFSKDFFLNAAKTLNLEATQFQNCLDNGETKPLVTRAFDEGQALGVDGTPFFFINGEKFVDEITADKIGQLLK